MARYVILFHKMPADDERASHWDLMLETDDGLMTWALESPPGPDAWIVAKPLPVHRLAYLDYEGPVSGNRGSVVRWDAGLFQWHVECDQEVVVQVRGQRLNGRVRLSESSTGNGWRLRYDPAPSDLVSPDR